VKCFSKRNRARRISGWGPRGTAETALELWAIVMKAIAFLLLFYFLFLLFLLVFIIHGLEYKDDEAGARI
jgi:hypothetical protein